MIIDDLINKWVTIPPINDEYKRIDSEHLLDIYLGNDKDSLKELMIVSKLEPAIVKSGKAINIEKNKRKDGLWATRMRLLQQEEESVFINLCFDLIESSRKGTTLTESLNIFFLRFLKWQRLMEKGLNILSEEIIRGLIGEIIYMRDYLSKFMNWDEVISAWLGIESADKDFIYLDTWAEIKTIGPSKNFITISSIEQLSSNSDGRLVVFEIDKTSSNDINGFSFSNLIAKTKEVLQLNPNALNEFESKLFEIGYYNHPEYEDKFYILNQCRQYRVDNSFPKITPKDLPYGVLNAKYDISLTAIKDFEISEV